MADSVQLLFDRGADALQLCQLGKQACTLAVVEVGCGALIVLLHRRQVYYDVLLVDLWTPLDYLRLRLLFKEIVHTRLTKCLLLDVLFDQLIQVRFNMSLSCALSHDGLFV